MIRPRPFGDEAEAAGWLEALRGSDDSLDEELTSAVAVLNLALHLHRCAQADHAARDVSSDSALVLRVGYGAGEAVAEGRFGSAWELPRHTGKVRRSMEAPDERFASMLGGREAPLACEEVVLRARADLDAGRHREAALQARIGLESLLAELPGLPETRRAALDEDRSPVGTAANTALRAQPDAASQQVVAGAVERMEAALVIASARPAGHQLPTGRRPRQRSAALLPPRPASTASSSSTTSPPSRTSASGS